ncbi:MAG: uracil-DNA glycosylase [Patescibacteria group bacterium]|nr:uracil-DNA glycosylase [Patescibacteria group bacterium]
MDKAEELKRLEEEMRADSNLPLSEANLVFGEGNPDTSVLFIGEAPGYHEDQQGRPFVGQAGKLLDKLIASVGWKREDVYITNIVKRRPPNNRDPLPEEIAAYAPYLKRQINIIDPKVIATLGRFSMNYFLPEAKISKDRGKAFILKGKIIFPLYHPAAALRSTSVSNELAADFAKIPIVVRDYKKITSSAKKEIGGQNPQKEEESEQTILLN